MDRTAKRNKEFERFEAVARLMDSKYRVPGTRFKFGLDPVLGLIPVLGDTFTFLISSGLIALMIRNGASGKVVVKMAINVLLDTIIGSIPLLGSVFDFFFKANMRNIRLLKEHYKEGKHQGSGVGLIIITLLILIIFFILAVWAAIELLKWLIGLF